MSGFTPSQRRAIELRGNVLVVAGAGTGKTRTLVQRCLEWLWEAPGDNSLDQVLMVTFTDAAAAEMRRRLRAEIEARAQPADPSGVWGEQLALLETAAISTLHSFCYRLVRQHFYELEIDPQVSILPAEEQQLLRDDTLTRLLQQHYSGTADENAAVRRLIEVQACGWEVPIRKLVWQLHAYAQSLPDPAGWFARQRAVLTAPEPVHWQSTLEAAIPAWLRDAVATLDTVDTANPNVAQCLAALRTLGPKPDLKDLQQALEQIRLAHEADWPRGSIKHVRDKIKDFFADAEFLRSALAGVALSPELKSCLSPANEVPASEWALDGLSQDWAWTRPHLRTLLDLTDEFGRQFASAKKELGALDFQDLEQFALQLLWDRTTDRPSPLAEEWRRKFRLIFVDEYQDINAAQDAILRALARDGDAANRFLVGDPKQSIYRFRLADPAIFQSYIGAWREPDGAKVKKAKASRPHPGQVVALRENFRSHAGILAFINPLFATVMRPEIGGIAYDDLSWLKFGNPEDRKEMAEPGPDGRPAVELHLRVTGQSESAPDETEEPEGDESAAENLSATEREARSVGLRLTKLRDERALIWDTELGERRPVTWCDMVILVRSPRFKAEAYAKEFARLEIPLTAARGGFLESIEIQDLLNLLRLLDNPVQDLGLLAVLHSPMVGLSVDELALARLAARGSLWHALQVFQRAFRSSEGTFRIESGTDPDRAKQDEAKWRSILSQSGHVQTAKKAWAKVDLFLKQWSTWRRFARQASVAETLSRVLDETNYLALLRPQLRGQQQRGNVAKLLHWARQFDQFHRQGLFRFLKFIDAQRDADIDHEPAPLDSHDAVRLMSIHQSKGLEFPVVVVADLGKAFNSRELKGDIILDPEFGLCPLVKPPFSEQRYPSVPHWLAERRRRRDFLGEEMRLLYVAMTRAADRLLLFGTATQTKVAGWTSAPARPSARELLAARNYLDWLGPCLAEPAGRVDWSNQARGRSGILEWFIYTDSDAPSGVVSSEPQEPARATPKSDGIPQLELDQLARRFHWSYPAQAASQQIAKASVSLLRVGLRALGDESSGPGVEFKPRRRVGRPKLSATELGTAHHKFLQWLSLKKTQSQQELEDEADRLQRAGRLTPRERTSLDLQAIEQFWSSPVGRAILAEGSSVQRELPFTFRLSLRELDQFYAPVRASVPADHSHGGGRGTIHLENEFVVVTGVADLVVLLPTEIWVLDFKTDTVSPAEWKRRTEQYEPQIRLYALALSRIHGRSVTRCWLHSLALGQTSSFT